MENSKFTICLEFRVLKQLIISNKYVDVDILMIDISAEILEIKKRFERIDKIMSELKVGDTLLLEDCDGGFEFNWFEQKVTEIVDVELGIVKVFEPNSVGSRSRDRHISGMLTEDEFFEKFPNATKKK